MALKYYVLAFIIAFSSGCISLNSNVNARSVNDQRYIEECLSKLDCGMSKEQVTQVINQRYSNEIMRMSWYPSHAGNRSRVQAYFHQDRLFKVTWIKMSGFMGFAVIYEKDCAS